MASNSSAAFFGVRDGDQQDQIKPLISPQQQLAAALPGLAGGVPAASGQGAPPAQPPPKKKRTMPGNLRDASTPPLPLLIPVVHAHCIQVRPMLPARERSRSSGSIGVL
jgi:hypothetical protein